MKDSWGDAVIRARRGPRKQQQSVYLNVKKKDPTHHSGDVDGLIPLSQALADLTVPDDWKGYSLAKRRMSGSGKSEQEHVRHFLHKT